jgi:hypothetical protein
MREWIAGIGSAIVTLYLMVNAETGAAAVACLFLAPVIFGMLMAFIDGITD